MSSLIFYTDETQALVATDTLAVDEEGTPAYFTTKAFILPHLRMIICGTGAGGFCDRWVVQVNNWIALRDIDDLDIHNAGSNLRQLWSNYKKYIRVSDQLTTTIYHLGFAVSDGLMHAHAYRSTNNFQSEKLNHGLYVKPECEVNEGDRLPQDLPLLMNRQRQIQAKEPASQRLYIGGEIQVIHFTQNGYQVYPVARFDDFEQMEKQIFR